MKSFLRKKDNFYEYPKEVPYSRATYIIIEIILEQDAGEKLGLKFTPPVIAISNSISICINKHTS